MPQHLHLDFETFSEIDLRDVGAYRYAFDPSTEILCAAMALEDEEPVCWSGSIPIYNDPDMEKYLDAFIDPSVLIYCHNAMFEMAILQSRASNVLGFECPDLSRFRCTMSLARRASLPAKLETLGEALGLDSKKDNRGKALIKKFSMLQPAKKATKAHPQGLPVRRIRPEDEPQAFAEFCEYCRQDVRAEQEVARRLAYFDEPINNANYFLDAVINARGVPVNLVALHHAQKLIDEETEIVSAKFRELTGFNVTQGAELLKWLKALDCELPDLQAETVDSFLQQYENHTDGYVLKHVEALRLKQSIAYAAIKKVATMLACAGPRDNKLRGMHSHHSATTGRWGHNLVQVGNMRRSTVKYNEQFYREVCAGESRDMLEVNYGSILENMASAIRHFIEDTGDDYLL